MKFFKILFLFAVLSVFTILTLNCSVKNLIENKAGSGNIKSESRNLSGFKKVNAGGAVNVEISIQNDYSVSIETDDNLLENIKTEISGNTLKIYSEGKISPTKAVNIKISMPAIEGLDISGASSANVPNIKADSFEIEVSGASKAKISGEAKSLKANANGASSIDAENLKAESVDVEASGASTATVSPINELKTEVSGASNVYYTGEPENVQQNSSGASSVKKK